MNELTGVQSTKVINLLEHTQYKKSILETAECLDKFQSELISYIIDIATKGKWKEWSDEQPYGTVFIFTPEMLNDTGDKNVDLLVEIYESILNAIEKLREMYFIDEPMNIGHVTAGKIVRLNTRRSNN